MNPIIIIRYFKYFFSFIKNIEIQNLNKHGPEESKKLSIFISKLKDFILIIDESKINYEDFNKTKNLDTKLYYITYGSSSKGSEFKELIEDLQNPGQIINFFDYCKKKIFWIGWDIVTKPFFNQEGWCKPFRKNRYLFVRDDIQDFEIHVDEVLHKIY